jgi:tetratricopeptide (TPR) repeat protein
MKTLLIIVAALFSLPLKAQINCHIYPENSNCRKGCELYSLHSDSWQGSKEEQTSIDSAITLCPAFAEGYRAKASSFIKSGQIRKWKVLIDRAVELDSSYLRIRGWYYFKFLKDYNSALLDLLKISEINNGFPGQSEDGDYDLRIVIALCYRELGDYERAMEVFDRCIRENDEKKKTGPFDYLHRGVLKLKTNDNEGALEDFQKQMDVYENFADAHYYLGKANKELGNTTVAHLNFKEAKDLYDKNLRRWDAYCEEIDLVYYEDILKEIENTR